MPLSMGLWLNSTVINRHLATLSGISHEVPQKADSYKWFKRDKMCQIATCEAPCASSVIGYEGIQYTARECNKQVL